MLECIFVGDVMPGAQVIAEKPDAKILRDFDQADFVIGNLECPFKKNLNDNVIFKKIPLWSTVDNIQILKQYRFSHMGLSNNHCFDLMEKGLEDTLFTLRKAGISPFGLKHDSIQKIATIEKNGIRVGIFAINWIETEHNPYLINFDIDTIKSLKESLDFLVCYVHWGNEHNIFVSRDQQLAAHRYIKAGVDLVIGHHPHVPQGIEIYSGKYIAYSLGNFLFTPKEFYDYLPYSIRYEDARENFLFQRTECKIGIYLTVRFSQSGFDIKENFIFRKNTIPAEVPKSLKNFVDRLMMRANNQVRLRDYQMYESERKRILLRLTLPFIARHPQYWPIFFMKLASMKGLRAFFRLFTR